MLKVDYTTLFIAATKNNEEYSRVQYNEDSPGKPWMVDRVRDQVQLYSGDGAVCPCSHIPPAQRCKVSFLSLHRF